MFFLLWTLSSLLWSQGATSMWPLHWPLQRPFDNTHTHTCVNSWRLCTTAKKRKGCTRFQYLCCFLFIYLSVCWELRIENKTTFSKMILIHSNNYESSTDCLQLVCCSQTLFFLSLKVKTTYETIMSLVQHLNHRAIHTCTTHTHTHTEPSPPVISSRLNSPDLLLILYFVTVFIFYQSLKAQTHPCTRNRLCPPVSHHTNKSSVVCLNLQKGFTTFATDQFLSHFMICSSVQMLLSGCPSPQLPNRWDIESHLLIHYM